MTKKGIETRQSFIELDARGRAKCVLDPGTFRELLDPFERMASPHLAAQGIVPQNDDGVVVGRGAIDGVPSVVIAIDGRFQGGGIGEVSGAKIAGALELAVTDNEAGMPTRAVIVLETGGVRLQEGNYGLLAIAEIHGAIVALRKYQPVVCIIAGMLGCFGGMSITAALCSTIIMTRQGRLGLNGPEVVEQEAGVQELDAGDRRLIWRMTGGEQRCSTGLGDELVEDDIESIHSAVKLACRSGKADSDRSVRHELHRRRIAAIDPSNPPTPEMLRLHWNEGNFSLFSAEGTEGPVDNGRLQPAVQGSGRGSEWHRALTGQLQNPYQEVPSVLCSDAELGHERVRFITVIPNGKSRFHRARHGEVGLDEGWTIAHYVRQAVEEDREGMRRPIVAIVDVPSQAYGFVEELLGLHQACAAAVEAYATARLSGHPVIALIVGNAISGAFLAHGLQANRIIALNDPAISVQVMSRNSIARVTRRSVEEQEEAARKLPAIAFDIRSFSSLGALHDLIDVESAQTPASGDIINVRRSLQEAIAASRAWMPDLSIRLRSEAAASSRQASIKVRSRMAEQWK